jgi:hypothetical protein
VIYQGIDEPLWNYRPVGEWFQTRVVSLWPGTTDTYRGVIHLSATRDLRSALQSLADSNHLPPRVETAGWIVDGNAKLVYGWVFPEPGRVKRAGVRSAYDLLAEILDPVTVAVWEIECKLQHEMERQ